MSPGEWQPRTKEHTVDSHSDVGAGADPRKRRESGNGIERSGNRPADPVNIMHQKQGRTLGRNPSACGGVTLASGMPSSERGPRCHGRATLNLHGASSVPPSRGRGTALPVRPVVSRDASPGVGPRRMVET